MGQRIDNVYVRTKLEAEVLVQNVRGKGLDARIYRIGNISYAKDGVVQKNLDDNAFYQQVKSYVNLGLAPDGSDYRDISFVEEVSQAILALYNRPALRGEIFHLQNPNTVQLSRLLTDKSLG